MVDKPKSRKRVGQVKEWHKSTDLVSAAIAKLPALPEHYNPIRALPEADKGKLLDAILQCFESGTSIYELAERLGVDNATIYRQLIKHRPDDWREVRAARYHSQIEQAEQDMRTAADPLAVTRAREQLANARWMLERLQRSIYGQDQAVDNSGRVSITLNIGQRQPLDVVGEVVKD